MAVLVRSSEMPEFGSLSVSGVGWLCRSVSGVIGRQRRNPPCCGAFWCVGRCVCSLWGVGCGVWGVFRGFMQLLCRFRPFSCSRLHVYTVGRLVNKILLGHLPGVLQIFCVLVVWPFCMTDRFVPVRPHIADLVGPLPRASTLKIESLARSPRAWYGP